MEILGRELEKKKRVCSESHLNAFNWDRSFFFFPSKEQTVVTHFETCLFLIKLTLSNDNNACGFCCLGAYAEIP